MREGKKELTKEQWNNCTEEKFGRRFIKSDCEMEIFGPSICCGYGLYGNHCREEEGKFYVYYTTGFTCD